jgi:hypothetical protein
MRQTDAADGCGRRMRPTDAADGCGRRMRQTDAADGIGMPGTGRRRYLRGSLGIARGLPGTLFRVAQTPTNSSAPKRITASMLSLPCLAQ